MEAVPHAVDPQRVAEHGGAVMRLVDEIFPLVEGFYVDLHKNPELSNQEHRTAGAVAEWLTRAGFDVETGVGGTGVVGVLRNGEGPTVLLRGDMDALPVQERTGLPYASTARGRDDDGRDVPIMHACGHDAHTACLVGTADLLAEARDEWHGTLMVVAQPGEETLDGATAMLRDGLYTRFGRPDVVLAQHLGPQPAGMVAHRAGTIMAATTNLRVRVFGSGGHAARPENTVDPVLIAANIVNRLQTIVAREISPSEMAVVTVGVLRAGTKANVIPEEAYLEVDTRALNPAVADRLHSAIDRIVRAEAAASGAQRDPEISVARETGVTANEPEATAEVVAAHRAYFGDDRVVELPEPTTGSEDFSAFGLPGDSAPVPYVYWFLGSTPHDVWEAAPGETPYEKLMGVPATHSPFFAPDRESTLRAGLAAMSLGALTYLGTPEAHAGAATGGQASMSAGPARLDEPAPAPEAAAFAESGFPAAAAPEGDAAAPAPDYPPPVPPTAVHPDEPAPAPAAADSGKEQGESTAYTDMDPYPSDDDAAPGYGPPPQGPPVAPPPQGPPVAAPPPQGPPVAAPPPPPGAVPYSTEGAPEAGGHPSGGYPVGSAPSGGYPAHGYPSGGYPAEGYPADGPPSAYPGEGRPPSAYPGGPPPGGYPADPYGRPPPDPAYPDPRSPAPQPPDAQQPGQYSWPEQRDDHDRSGDNGQEPPQGPPYRL
ncbi:amidohydrolase [Streptomonospora sp. DSM 45055]|uniref:Amidohydrolase n=1 Tax=Streptomonospora wellingtoniae TaxID=3075544 RepID=A0ABU2KQV0_9ACTN|nr:amidohydrolase [Streptomonospora sp. DSM 45055]MDT0301667.1 amidohydrolase [Streptomonospora sp. DSM 45055]